MIIIVFNDKIIIKKNGTPVLHKYYIYTFTIIIIYNDIHILLFIVLWNLYIYINVYSVYIF